MDSNELKPLIFMAPLSETLKKLKEVMSQNAESEGVEIYEVESLDEIGQLLPNIGQSVTMTSSPKKTAMMLQQNRKVVKAMQNKIIMLSPKSIPRKTLDKFMKIGLTECIVEPVNPKTLMYKVNLQLRSISTSKEKGDLEQIFDDSTEKKEKSIGLKQKKIGQKKEEVEEESSIKEKKKAEEVTMENYAKVNKKGQAEEIESHYKGKQKKKEEEIKEESDKEQSHFEEDDLGGHYKGALKKSSIDIEEELDDKLPEYQDLDPDELEELKRKMALEVQEDLQDRPREEGIPEKEAAKKASKQINVEEEVSNDLKKENDSEDLGGHYKGQMKQSLDIEEDDKDFQDKAQESQKEEEGKESQAGLQIEDDNQKDYKDEKEDILESEKTQKKKNSLDLVDDPDSVYEDKEAPLEQEEQTKDHKLSVEEEQDQKDSKSKGIELIDNEGASKNDSTKADEIDKYMRSPNAKKETLDIDEEDDLYQKAEIEKEAKELESKESAKIELIDELDEEEIKTEAQEKDSKDKNDSPSLDIEDEKQATEAQSKEELEKGTDTRTKAELDIQEDLKRKSLSEKEEKEKKGHNRSNAKADHIKTHYSSKNSIKHNDNDWGDGKERPENTQDGDFKKREEEKSLFMQKEELGEQTIDYGKLKSEFDAISYEGQANKKKKYGIFSETAEVKTFTKSVYDVDQQLVKQEFEEVLDEEEVEVNNQVFEPNPVGMDVAVEVLNFYMTKGSEFKNVFRFISNKIKERYQGEVSFYLVDKETKIHQSQYISRVEDAIGLAPLALNDDDKETMTSKEYKALEKDYQRDLEQYESKKVEAMSDWDQYYQEQKETWQTTNIPTWKDKTFQSSHNQFIFPYFDGPNALGFAAVTFEYLFEEIHAKSIEMILESARGIYLAEHQEIDRSSKESKKETDTKGKKKNEKKKGLLSGLWGKIAG